MTGVHPAREPLDAGRIDAILGAAAAEGRFALLEHEVYGVLEAAGCRVPRAVLVPAGESPDRASREIGGARVMLKIAAPGIAHKTEVGGVAESANDPAAIRAGIDAMLAAVPRPPSGDLRGVLVVERVAVDGAGPGAEALVALRQTREFGPVLTMGVGGVDTELLAAVSRPGQAVVSASAALQDAPALLGAFRSTLAWRRLSGATRAGRRLVDDAEILRVVEAFRALGERYADDGQGAWTIAELEVNPFAASGGRLVALDGLLAFRPKAGPTTPRPLESLGAVLRPRSIGIVGVSAHGRNVGRIILDNIRGAGFDPARIVVVRPDCTGIDGVACVSSIRELPERVDLFVVALSAEQVPGIVEELVEHDRAVGVIVIPGGMAEKEGGEVLEGRLADAIRVARSRRLPLVVNGGNCLGIVSRPGRYDTLFIPRSKLPVPEYRGGGVAIVSQSGAFMITRLSHLPWLSPRYAISTGNQVDLTIGDFVAHLAGDPEVTTIAVYVEGFRDGDGLRFARAVRDAVQGGRDVLFYKAGRTAEGRRATAGHTASIAGDYDVCEAIVQEAGAVVARSFDEFQGLLKISALLGRRRWRGRRLAAMSNAGYEAVGIADSLRGDGWSLELAALAPATRAALGEALARGHAGSLVDVRNPIDLTPMADDEVHEDVLRAFLEDPGVDLVVCSTIPLTAATATLPEEVGAEGSLPARLARLLSTTDKPIVASIDSGPLFDPLARAIEAQGVPVFRAADAALRAAGRYLEARLRR